MSVYREAGRSVYVTHTPGQLPAHSLTATCNERVVFPRIYTDFFFTMETDLLCF